MTVIIGPPPTAGCLPIPSPTPGRKFPPERGMRNIAMILAVFMTWNWTSESEQVKVGIVMRYFKSN